MLIAPNLSIFPWLKHGFGMRDSVYPAEITTVKQIHSCLVIEACRPGDRVAEADALVSNEPGVVVGVRTADCVPILLVDTETRAIAAVHAGWRGTAANIVAETVARMRARFGTKPANLCAAVGPSIGFCCYEVGPDVAGQFRQWTEHPTRLDLPSINELQLRQTGVTNIWNAGVCTYCEVSHYFSYRREKEQAGRMLSWIGTDIETAG